MYNLQDRCDRVSNNRDKKLLLLLVLELFKKDIDQQRIALIWTMLINESLNLVISLISECCW